MATPLEVLVCMALNWIHSRTKCLQTHTVQSASKVLWASCGGPDGSGDTGGTELLLDGLGMPCAMVKAQCPLG